MNNLKYLICILLLYNVTLVCGQNNNTFNNRTVIEGYCNNTKMWTYTRKREHRKVLTSIIASKRNTIVQTKLHKRVRNEIKEDSIKSHYKFETYIANIEKWLENKTFFFDIINIETLTDDEILIQTQRKDINKIKDENAFYKGRLHIRDTLNIQKNVKKKDVYEELYVVDKNNNRVVTIVDFVLNNDKKVIFNLADLEDNKTFGASINYSPNWPFSLSASYSSGYFMIGLDGGFNTDHDQVVQKILTMQNILNYQKETISYDPQWYITATPSLYLKYLSVGCGAGIMYSERNIDPLKKGKNRLYHISFMLRPTIKGYIPLNDEWFLTVNTSYDWAMDLKIKNGMSFGLGLQYRMY